MVGMNLGNINLIQVKDFLYYKLGSAGFNMNYFLLGLLQTSVLMMIEKIASRELL
jgi:hypothetical protein